jgi:hypothetical protein
LLADYQPEPGQVAIVYDDTSDMLSHLQDHAESGDTQADIHCYKSNLKGWYRLFWDANIPADVLSSRSTEDWARYRVVILPSMLFVSPAMRQRLADYLAAGGKLIVDSGFDTREENGWAKLSGPGGMGSASEPRPSQTRPQVRSTAAPGRDFGRKAAETGAFGPDTPGGGRATYENMIPPADPPLAAMLDPARPGKQLLAEPGRTLDSPFGPLPVGQYLTTFPEPTGPWGSWQGDRLTYFAFNPGEARFLHPRADFSALLRWLESWTGLKPAWPGLRVRRGRSAGREVCFVHNLGAIPAAFPFPGSTDLLAGATNLAPDSWAVLAT